jgi:hypothetical protein
MVNLADSVEYPYGNGTEARQVFHLTLLLSRSRSTGVDRSHSPFPDRGLHLLYVTSAYVGTHSYHDHITLCGALCEGRLPTLEQRRVAPFDAGA